MQPSRGIRPDRGLGEQARKAELLPTRKVELLPAWGTQGGTTADPSGKIGAPSFVPLPIFDSRLGARGIPDLPMWGAQGGRMADPSGETGAPNFVPLPIFDSRLGARGYPALPAWGAQDGKTVDNPGENGIIVGEDIEGAGDYYTLAEKARNVDVSSSAHQAVFYSGKGNRARAEAFAELNGKTTLEMTPGGKYFDSLKLFEDGSPVTKDQAYEIWKILSERYAKAASGNVYGFVKGSFPESIFNTVEYPALQENPYITNIFTELLN